MRSIVKNELIQFIAAAVSESPLSKEEARHDIVALLLEETLKLAKDENGEYDQFILKPLYKAQIIALEARMESIRKEALLYSLDHYKDACKLLESCAGTTVRKK